MTQMDVWLRLRMGAVRSLTLITELFSRSGQVNDTLEEGISHHHEIQSSVPRNEKRLRPLPGPLHGLVLRLVPAQGKCHSVFTECMKE